MLNWDTVDIKHVENKFMNRESKYVWEETQHLYKVASSSIPVVSRFYAFDGSVSMENMFCKIHG